MILVQNRQTYIYELGSTSISKTSDIVVSKYYRTALWHQEMRQQNNNVAKRESINFSQLELISNVGNSSGKYISKDVPTYTMAGNGHYIHVVAHWMVQTW